MPLAMRWTRARLLPGAQRDVLEHLRRHDQRVRGAQGDATVDVTFDLEAARLVGVEAVFVMDDRRRPLCEDAGRHHAVDRAPIVRQHQIEPPHEPRERLVARHRRATGERRSVLRDLVTDVAVDRRARAELVGHAADDRVTRGVAEGVHQPHRPRLLAAQAEARMEMQDVDGLRHGARCSGVQRNGNRRRSTSERHAHSTGAMR